MEKNILNVRVDGMELQGDSNLLPTIFDSQQLTSLSNIQQNSHQLPPSLYTILASNQLLSDFNTKFAAPSPAFQLNPAMPYLSPTPFSSYTNELSLSLATSHPAVISDHSSAAATSWNSCNSNEISVPQFSQVILGSTYLQAIQEILAQIATYSLENSHEPSCLIDRIGINPFSSERGMPWRDIETRPVQTKKTQLLTLLQVVCTAAKYTNMRAYTF